MSDVKAPTATGMPTVAVGALPAGVTPVATPKPATDFHAPAAPGLLDLRQATPKITAKPQSAPAAAETVKTASATIVQLTPVPISPQPVAVKSEPTPAPKPITAARAAAQAEPAPVAITPVAQPLAGVTPAAAAKIVLPASVPTASAPVAPAANVIASDQRKQARLANAQNTATSDLIKKFPSHNPPVNDINAPTVPLAAPPRPIVAPPAETMIAPTSPFAAASTTEILPLTPAAPTAPPAAAAPGTIVQPPAPAPTSAVMPRMVATTIAANNRLLTPQALAQADPETARKEAFALAMANAPKRNSATSVAAAAAVVLMMGGYIWFQNAPKLAVRTASNVAGFEASLPTYMPGNYSLNKKVSSSPGQLILSFNAPDSSGISITQQKTNWDSKSLLDNYVSKQTSQYLAVNGQGLTIYVYNGDVASWVNQGIWYSIQGNNQLNREQLLKIAYGL